MKSIGIALNAYNAVATRIMQENGIGIEQKFVTAVGTLHRHESQPGSRLTRLRRELDENIDTDGPRVFNVNIQGKPVLKDFDVQKEAGGVQKALIKEFKGVEVTNGTLEVKFIALEQNPEINGIEVIAE